MFREMRLASALAEKDAAIGIFKTAKERLNGAIRKLTAHNTESRTIIQDRLKEIDQEKALIEKNQQHIEHATKQIVKINEILG